MCDLSTLRIVLFQDLVIAPLLNPLIGGVSVQSGRLIGKSLCAVLSASILLAFGSASIAAHFAHKNRFIFIVCSRCCRLFIFPKRIISSRNRAFSSADLGGGGATGRNRFISFFSTADSTGDPDRFGPR